MYTIEHISIANEEIFHFIYSLEDSEQYLKNSIEKIIYSTNPLLYKIILNKKTTSLIFKKYEIPLILISKYSRFNSENIYIQNRICTLFTDFIFYILDAKIDNFLKIAIISDLNFLGYMFDRSKDNYSINLKIIEKLISKIIIFKSKLTNDELSIWNATTYSGEIDGQALAFSLFSNGCKLGIINSQITL